jgi:dynein heavy chain
MERKLIAAVKLIDGLGAEEKRWGENKVTLKENLIKLTGDCLVCSAFLSYVGPFDASFRKVMVFDDWLIDV